MKVDLGSPLHTPAHPVSEAFARKISETSATGSPITSVAEAPLSFAQTNSPEPQAEFNVARDLALFARALRHVKGSRIVLVLFSAWVLATIASMVGQVRFNKWYGAFFDAIGKKDLTGF